jgi:hypothetical protein
LKGADPAAAHRGTYASAIEARNIVFRAGGMVKLVASSLEPLGCVRTEIPLDGDIGVVKVPTTFYRSETDRIECLAVGIAFGPLWAICTELGIKTSKFEPVAIWNVP